jgi:small-conductance mechanosensitive channel
MKPNLFNLLTDVIMWIFQVVIGVAAKLAFDSRKRKITTKYVITSFIIACFVGYITDKVWTAQGWEDTRGVAVAIMALLSETVVKYANDNLPSILNALIKKRLDVEVKDKPKEEE